MRPCRITMARCRPGKCTGATLSGLIPEPNDGACMKCRNRLPTIAVRGLIIRRIPFPCGISIAVADTSCASSLLSKLPDANSGSALRDGKFEFEDNEGGKTTGHQ